VGRALFAQSVRDPAKQVRGSTRRATADFPAGGESVLVADLSSQTDWSQALRDVEVVVHTAARVHVMKETSSDPLVEFRRTNVEGTLALARQAAAAGVRRFVFVSSVKVNGEQTVPGKPFTARDTANPLDPYGISKLEAELGLRQLAAQSGMEFVIVRPALVYGPGVRGNFLTLLRSIHRGVPLPLGAIRNKRSFIALHNLVDLILTCVVHPRAADQLFLAADGEDLSITELATSLGMAMDRPVRLFRVPSSVLEWGAKVLGKEGAFQRVCGWLQVDALEARQRLQWSPVVTATEALCETARSFASTAR
jgi:UDP-glucose 4-epimerase